MPEASGKHSLGAGFSTSSRQKKRRDCARTDGWYKCALHRAQRGTPVTNEVVMSWLAPSLRNYQYQTIEQLCLKKIYYPVEFYS